MKGICDNNPWYGFPERPDCHVEEMHKEGRTIAVRRPHVLFKVANAARIEADALPDESRDNEVRKMLLDIMDDGNSERVTELLDLAFADILEMAGDEEDAIEDADIDVDDDDYVLTLRKSVTPKKANRVLRPRIEEYMVAYVLWQWLMYKGYAALSEAWHTRVEDMKSAVKSLLKGSRTKRPMSPF